MKARRIALWAFGILACGIFGGMVGSNLLYSDGGFLGFFGGAFAFARLWLTENGDPKGSRLDGR